MTQRTETLATTFEGVANHMMTEVKILSDTAWNTVPAGEARTAGQIAHHMANVYHNVSGFIQLAMDGQPLPDWTMDDIHSFNAEQAAHSANVDREDVLEMLRHNGAAVATTLRTLSDTQLNTNVEFLGHSMTVENLVQNALVGHIEEHLASIQSAATSV